MMRRKAIGGIVAFQISPSHGRICRDLLTKYVEERVTKQGCTKRSYKVTADDLPLCCPMPQYRLWDAHPRVYLPIERVGHAVCPYCEAEYRLQGPKDQNMVD